MRIGGLCALALFAFTGCVDDASSSADSPVDAAVTDVQTSGGSADAGCGDMPAPWWCVQDMGLVDGALGDAAKPDDGKPDGGKKPDGDKTSGWSGLIDGESATYTFNRLNDTIPTCRLTYPLTQIVEAEDCEGCERAIDATLGEVQVDLDTGGCGDVLGRAGEMVGFGHSATVDEAGKNLLKMRKDGAWYDVPDGGSGINGEGGWLFYHPASGEAPPPPGGETGKWLEGEVDTESGAGFYRFYSQLADGALNCEINYPVVGASPNDTCDECSLAWDMPLSAPDREMPGQDCQFFGGLGGSTVTHGQTEDGRLMVLKNGTWSDAGGTSGLDGTVWRFSLELNF